MARKDSFVIGAGFEAITSNNASVESRRNTKSHGVVS